MWAAIAGAAISGAVKASKAPGMSPTQWSTRQVMGAPAMINIAPVGTNVGEILRMFEGPITNGGFGAMQSRYLQQGYGGETLDTMPDILEGEKQGIIDGMSDKPWLIYSALALAVGVGFYVWRRA